MAALQDLLCSILLDDDAHTFEYVIAMLQTLFGYPREKGFQMAMEVSCYSFIRMLRRAEPLMHGGGACLTISYLGSKRAVPAAQVNGHVIRQRVAHDDIGFVVAVQVRRRQMRLPSARRVSHRGP